MQCPFLMVQLTFSTIFTVIILNDYKDTIISFDSIHVFIFTIISPYIFEEIVFVGNFAHLAPIKLTTIDFVGNLLHHIRP